MTYDPNSFPNRDPNSIPPSGDTGNTGWMVGAIVVIALIVGLFYWGSTRSDMASNTMTAPPSATTTGMGGTSPLAPRTTTGSGSTSTLPSISAPTDRAPANPNAAPPVSSGK